MIYLPVTGHFVLAGCDALLEGTGITVVSLYLADSWRPMKIVAIFQG